MLEPAAPPQAQSEPALALAQLGERLRLRRKAMSVNATTAAQAAGMSRVTLHRIERGEASVSMGAWASLAQALGWRIQAGAADEPQNHTSDKLLIPTQIELAQYPQLAAIAWHLPGLQSLSPAQAFKLYERNARHIDDAALTQPERELMEALRITFADLPVMSQPLAGAA